MTADLGSRPRPADGYDEAVARIGMQAEADAAESLVPEGPAEALLTGARARRAVVLFHGYTSVPGQFGLIARAYRLAGCNVWVPRMPFHGRTDRMTGDLSRLTSEMLRDHADRAIDIAAGLGDIVTAVGLSGGGSIATWCAVERPEVTDTVAISPLMQPLGVPVWITRALVATLPHTPDAYAWWYPKLRDQMPGYGYPRFSYKGIAALLGLVYWTEQVAERWPYPVPGRYKLVRNAGDDRLDGAFNERLVRRLVPPERLTVYEIPASDRLVHDIVTTGVGAENRSRIDVAYRHLSVALGVNLPEPDTT